MMLFCVALTHIRTLRTHVLWACEMNSKHLQMQMHCCVAGLAKEKVLAK